jgi:DNA polymerase/3'-5' exonuclease PolX
MYKRNNDVRSFSYVRAVAIIKSHSKEILCADDIKEVRDLSKSMFQKVKEIIETGSIVKMQKFSNSEEMTVRKNLEKVWGVGPKKAKEFYNKGVKSVEDLRKRPELISKQMAVGLKYFDEFAVRIPRDKVSRIF